MRISVKENMGSNSVHSCKLSICNQASPVTLASLMNKHFFYILFSITCLFSAYIHAAVHHTRTGCLRLHVENGGSGFRIPGSSMNQLCDSGRLPSALCLGFLIYTTEIIMIPSAQVMRTIQFNRHKIHSVLCVIIILDFHFIFNYLKIIYHFT